MERSFKSLFKLMFSEEENILYEKTSGFMIIKTTYGQAKRDILKRASILREMIVSGDKVGLYMDNSLDWIENFWALIIAGKCPLLLNLRVDKRNLEKILKENGIQYCISDGVTFACSNIKNADIVSEIETANTIDFESVEFGEEFYVMSSGTSSNIKVCAYTAEEVWYQINDSGDIIKTCTQIKKHFNGQLKLLTFLPFYHIFGLVAVYVWFTFFGRTLVQLNDMRPDTITGTIKRHQVTHIFAVPLFWETVYSTAKRTIASMGDETVKKFEMGMRLSEKLSGNSTLCRAFGKLAYKQVRDNLFGDSIQFMITGGSAISADAIKFFNYIGYHLADGYGMSEIGITSVELSRSMKRLNSCSVGSPLTSFEYRINDAGELEVRGKACAHYIIIGGEKQPKTEWFNTKDLVEYKNGRYFISGRSDDLVISASGENLNPAIIEPLFEDIIGSEGVALVKYTDEKVIPTVVISVAADTDNSDLIIIRKRAEARVKELGLSGEIGKIIVLPEPLMRPEEFKLNRRTIGERATAYQKRMDAQKAKRPIFDMSRPLNSPAPVSGGKNASEDIVGQAVDVSDVKKIVLSVLNTSEEEADINTNIFTELGANSLDYLAIMADVEKDYDVRLPIEENEVPVTIREIYEYICSCKQHS